MKIASEQAKKTGFRGPDPSVGKATQFKPGISGNAGGRPRTRLISAAYRAILETENPDKFTPATGAERVALAQYKRAVRGGVRHAKEIADRTEGRPSQRIELAGEDEGLTINIRRVE